MLRLARGMALAAASAAAFSHAAFLGDFTGTFEPIQSPVCYTLYGTFTTGGQYLDANNGVIDNVHSMLARWQGDGFVDNPVTYDMGRWNGAHITPQRGYQPQDSSSGSGGASVYCMDFGMLINTKFNPHRPVVGGGYNDMYGYSWAAGIGPRPFVENSAPTDLVLQVDVGLNTFIPMVAGSWATSGTAASANVGLYAYLRDTTHTDLPPIIVLAMTHTADDLRNVTGAHWDYNASDSSTWNTKMSGTGWSIPANDSGAWFVAGPILADGSNLNAFVTTYFTVGQTSTPVPGTDTGGSSSTAFYRAHIRPEDWVKVVDAIAGDSCAGPPNCPAKSGQNGPYSRNPNDYELAYAGLISEVTLRGDNLDANPPVSNFDAGPSNWVPNDINKAQVMLGVKGYALGIYRGIH